MNFTDIAQRRQSCRNFDSTKSVEKEKILACLEVARLAPSACNSQPWHFTVCTGENSANEKNLVAQVAALTQGMGMNKFASDASAFVIVTEVSSNITATIGSKVKRLRFSIQDIGIATAYFTAEAEAQSLSTCILGWFDEKKLKQLTGIKNKIRLVIAIGYAKSDDKIRIKKRKSLEEIADWL